LSQIATGQGCDPSAPLDDSPHLYHGFIDLPVRPFVQSDHLGESEYQQAFVSCRPATMEEAVLPGPFSHHGSADFVEMVTEVGPKEWKRETESLPVVSVNIRAIPARWNPSTLLPSYITAAMKAQIPDLIRWNNMPTISHRISLRP
jgi:hypothetical protein